MSNPHRIAIRWNGVIIGVFALVALCFLFTGLIMLLKSPDKTEAHWGAVMAIIGFIGGFMAGCWATAHMRFDESPPQMPVSDAIEFARLAATQQEALGNLAADADRIDRALTRIESPIKESS